LPGGCEQDTVKKKGGKNDVDVSVYMCVSE